jgi:hypothetical protein
LVFFFQDKAQMNTAQNFDRLARTISTLGRNEVEKKIRNFRGRFKLDFTDEYLNSLTVERLRHILFAALATKFNRTN